MSLVNTRLLLIVIALLSAIYALVRQSNRSVAPAQQSKPPRTVVISPDDTVRAMKKGPLF